MAPDVQFCQAEYRQRKEPIFARASSVPQIGFLRPTIPALTFFTSWRSRAATYFSRNPSHLPQAKPTTARGRNFLRTNVHKRFSWRSPSQMARKFGGILRLARRTRGAGL